MNWTVRFELDLAVQLCVSSMNSNGLSTQPWGTPVLRVVEVKVVMWIIFHQKGFCNGFLSKNLLKKLPLL